MSKWILAVVLGLLTHFGASYLVPLEEKDQGALGGVLRWVWPWGIGDSRILGRLSPGVMPMAGVWLATAGAVLCALAALAVLGIWAPTRWWRVLAITGASALVLVMLGFLGPTKIFPILVGLAVVWAATLGSAVFKVE